MELGVCRICFSSSAEKELSFLKCKEKDVNLSYEEILLFCLDIKVLEDCKITQKLCMKCYRKIMSFYKFKRLALKNDEYLRTVQKTCDVKLDQTEYEKSEIEISTNPFVDCDDIYLNDSLPTSVKEEPDIKEEQQEEPAGYQSDEELLSVIKMIKYEQQDKVEETKNNVSAPVKKRGRPKSIKIKTIGKTVEVCDECGKSVRNLKEHVKKHLPRQDRKQIQCKACDKVFTTYGSRYKHYRIKHLGIKKHCDICNKDVIDLRVHNLMQHDPDKLPFPCVMCPRRFISPSALEEHVTVHTKDKPFQCDVCQKGFRLKVLLQLHIRQVHDKEKAHLCQYCSKSFFKKYHLQIHIRSHTKEKPYKCSECGNAFSSSTGLRHHMLTHGERTYRCDHCDSTFARLGYLRNHQLVHTKARTHPCRYCGVKFGRTDHRRRHEFTAHEKNLLST